MQQLQGAKEKSFLAETKQAFSRSNTGGKIKNTLLSYPVKKHLEVFG